MILLRLVALLFAGSLIATGLLMLNSSLEALFSFLVAYFSSAFVLIISFRNYQNMVQKGVEAKSFVVDNRDTIERIDDPFDLYSDEIQYNKEASIKEVIKAEKKALKRVKIPLKERAKNTLFAFKFSRILSYFILVLGFLYLLKVKQLVLSYYLLALIVPIVIVVIYLYIIGSKFNIEDRS